MANLTWQELGLAIALGLWGPVYLATLVAILVGLAFHHNDEGPPE